MFPQKGGLTGGKDASGRQLSHKIGTKHIVIGRGRPLTVVSLGKIKGTVKKKNLSKRRRKPERRIERGIT